jgi:hypothetical protein
MDLSVFLSGWVSLEMMGWFLFTACTPLLLLGEPGLLLTQVLGHHPFMGYRGPREQTEQKLVRDVRRSGDVYFNTGDVLALDHEGFFYFRDRLGDTFRSGAGLQDGSGGGVSGASCSGGGTSLPRGMAPSSGFHPAGGKVRTCPRGRWRACCRSWTSCRK